MKQTLTLEIPDDVYQALQQEADQTGKSLERLALDWLSQQARRGRVETLMPFFGAWRMTPEERAQIEKMLDEERHLLLWGTRQPARRSGEVDRVCRSIDRP
jgi:hypothetical protein